MLFVTPKQAQRLIRDHLKTKRLNMDLTQEGLASRSGVSLSTLRKFEQSSEISFKSLMKIISILGDIDDLVEYFKPGNHTKFKSIDEVIKANQEKPVKKRGKRK
jgi:transcriptional regulator with XRE-family HTH domain